MRIVTRPDFDGIVCAVLLFEALQDQEDLSPDIFWTEPGEIQADQAGICPGDILANLPFDQRCALWFDHHISNRPDMDFNGGFSIAPSAANVVLAHYQSLGKLDHRFDELVKQTDMIDSADLTLEQVKNPEKDPWVMLSMTIQNHDYQDTPYWNRLVELLRKAPNTNFMEDPEIKKRCDEVTRENLAFKDHLKAHTRIIDQVSVTDFRSLDPVPSGNRFLTYSLFPETTVSVKIRYKDQKKSQVLVSIGRSIFNPGCRVNVGKLLSRYGGGGHAGAGGCTMNSDIAPEKIDEILAILRANSPSSSPEAV